MGLPAIMAVHTSMAPQHPILTPIDMPKHKNRVRRMYSVTLDTLPVLQVMAVGRIVDKSFSEQVREALLLYLAAHEHEHMQALARAGEGAADPPPSPSKSRVVGRERTGPT